jgi:predicted transcriptional regulator
MDKFRAKILRAKLDRMHLVQRLREKGMTYAQIGKELGVSRQRAHQIAIGR